MAILRGMGAERSLAVATRAWDLGITPSRCPCRARRTSRRCASSPTRPRARADRRGGHRRDRRAGARGEGCRRGVHRQPRVRCRGRPRVARRGAARAPRRGDRNGGPARARRGPHLAEGLPGQRARHGLVPGDARAVPTGAASSRPVAWIRRTHAPSSTRERASSPSARRSRTRRSCRVGGAVRLSQRTGAVVAANACSRAAPSTSGWIVAVAVAIAPTMQMTAT